MSEGNLEERNMTDLRIDSKEIAEREWKKQKFLMKKVKDQGGFEYYISDVLEAKDEIFASRNGVVACIDEGAKPHLAHEEGALRIPGAGILLPGGAEVAADLYNKYGIEAVMAHEECGAARLAYLRAYPDSDPSWRKIDEYGQDFASKVAKKAGINFVFQPLDMMYRPQNLHIASGIYVDLTEGSFRPSDIKGLPGMFTVSRKPGLESSFTESLNIATSIAFGDHGFGAEKFSEQPFTTVIVAPEDKMKEAYEIVTKAFLEGDYAGLFRNGAIEIDELIEPAG